MDWPLLIVQGDSSAPNWNLLLQGGAVTAALGAIAAVLGTLIKRSQALGTTNIGDLAKFRAELMARSDRAEAESDASDRRLSRAIRMVAILSGDLVMLVGFVENATESLRCDPPNVTSAARVLEIMLGKLNGITLRVEREISALTEEAAQAKTDAPKPEPPKVSAEISQKKDE